MAGKIPLKKILVGAFVVIFAVGLSVGATLFFLSGKQATTASTEPDEGVVVPAAGPPAEYYAFDRAFITTVSQGEKSRYLQVFVALLLRNQATKLTLETHDPLLRSQLLTLFGKGDFLALQSEAGRQALKSDALTLINRVLATEGAAPVEQVLFTGFVLQ